MICDHARCTAEATVRCRMGDGYFRYDRSVRRQTFVHYCDEHFGTVAELFALCDVQPVRVRDLAA